MSGTPETFVQNTFITASRGKFIVNWQQLGFSNEPNSVGAEHINSLQSLEKSQQVFLPHARHGKIQFKEAISFPIFYSLGKEQVEVPEAR